MLTAISGINWGDEGKGRMVDLLSEDFDVVVRYQGGNNAGHTVINDKGRFILNLLPSGILRDKVVNVMGQGMVIDLAHLTGEVKRLTDAGIAVTPQNLKISDKAVICMPYHVKEDCLEEERLGEAKFGSTKRGIAPVYGDKYMKKVIRTGDLLHEKNLLGKLETVCDWKNLTFSGYGAEKTSATEMLEWLLEYGNSFKPYICDTAKFLLSAEKSGKKIMFEAQLGALRDVDFGIFPYTSSSSTISAYAPIGAGVPGLKLNNSIGIMKAYSTCVGEGPFVAELFDGTAELIRKEGAEFGAATGRPRRVGAFDVPASKYGAAVQGSDEIALTKLDVLSCLDKIPVCISYELDGKIISEFPYPALLADCRPVYEYLDGWKEDISHCKRFGDLPDNAKKYVKFLSDAVGAKFSYVSVGPERNQYMKL